YAVVGWLLLQIAEVTFEPFGVPDSAMRFLVIAVVLGFPVALVLAWAFDIGSQGIIRTESAGHDDGQRSKRWMEFTIVGLLVLVVSLGGYIIFRPDQQAGAPSLSDDKSIAVLPFVNMSADPTNEYFSDGISEELLNVLAKIEGLRVAARTSSFAYKGKNQNIQDIGSELSVSTVLEGSVRKSQDRVRITAQLIDVENGYHIWSNTYDRKLTDIFDVQDEISAAIVNALKVTLLGGGERTANERPTDSIAAYELYLRGRHEWRKRTEESIKKATEYFEQAIAVDPNYTLAYTGLADSYMLLESYGNLSIAEARPKAQAAVDKALALNDQLAEAHASLGLILNSEGKFQEAEQAYLKSIELDPDYAMAHLWYGNTLGSLTKQKESFKQYERAYELEPFMYPTNTNLAYGYKNIGRYRDSITHFDKLARIKPENAGLYLREIAEAYHNAGELPEAVRRFHRALETVPDNSDALADLGLVYLQIGDANTARYWIEMAYGIDKRGRNVARAMLMLLISQEEFESALDVTQRYLENDPQDPEFVLWNMFLALLQEDENLIRAHDQKLKEVYGDTLGISFASINFVTMYASYLRDKGDTAAATRLLEKTVDFISDNQKIRLMHQPWQYYILAETHALLGNGDLAVANLHEAIERGWRWSFIINFGGTDMFANLDDNYASRIDNEIEELNRRLQQDRAIIENLEFDEYILPVKPQPASINPDIYDSYVGYFRFDGNNEAYEITREREKLFFVFMNGNRHELIPESETRFFMDDTPQRVEFVRDEFGEVNHFLSIANGSETRAKRFDYAPPTIVEVDPSLYTEFAGTYQFANSFSIKVERAGDRLFAIPEGQGRAEMFPESEYTYFLKISTAKLSFLRDETGQINKATLHLEEADLPGDRITD
ncbi:MAG: tetratricopeptide repeat protein, partial [Gammaproteobacteria bacterium]|nr:tetratricopeptide repeat protein [Gammaproteobacteria bacterium]